MKISIIVPFTFCENWSFLLSRCLASIHHQTFTDHEIILLKFGRAAETQNRLIDCAQGELIKILHMDDFFAQENSLQKIVDSFGKFDNWMATGCLHQEIGEEPKIPHFARYVEDIHTGNNCIGSPSVITFRNDLGVHFDPSLDWLYDVDFYKQLHQKYGAPHILDDLNVVIGLHLGQLTRTIPDSQKISEVATMKKRYA